MLGPTPASQAPQAIQGLKGCAPAGLETLSRSGVSICTSSASGGGCSSRGVVASWTGAASGGGCSSRGVVAAWTGVASGGGCSSRGVVAAWTGAARGGVVVVTGSLGGNCGVCAAGPGVRISASFGSAHRDLLAAECNRCCATGQDRDAQFMSGLGLRGDSGRGEWGRRAGVVAGAAGSVAEVQRGAAMGSESVGDFNVSLMEEGGLSGELAEDLVREALVWASLHGLVMSEKSDQRSGTCPGIGMVHVPLALLPTPFPKQAFAQAVELAPHFNTLVDRVSQDTEFLQEALARTRKVDSFMARLMAIHSQILEEGIKQDIQLGLHRSDYMLDMATGALLQVELNTISCSFAGLGSLTSKLHRYLVGRFRRELCLDIHRVPENKAADSFVEGLGMAWLESGDPNAAVLMVVHEKETNMYDQQWLSLKLYQSYGVKVVRRTFAEVYAQAKLDEKRTLFIGKQAISVVYYRSGYSPGDYRSDRDWKARMLLERSSAVKCPSISYHLVGAKKIQQELAKPGVLERFLQDKEVIAKIRECFAGLWSLEGEGSDTILKEAVARPEGFVLKPQREGGGNNIYGEDVAMAIKKLRQEEGGAGLAAYILMQRIFPAINTSYIIRNGVWRTEKTLSELGIYSTYLRNGNREILNKQAGHLVRTKVADSDEGGVVAGYGVLDGPYLR